MELSTGNEIVDKLRSIKLTGNVIPPQWYKQLTYDSGNAYLLAITILSDIYYWYKPAEIRDELSGNLIGYKKKFKSDFLQRSYSSLADMFGCSKRQATEAIIFLEKKGLIKRHFRTIVSGDIKCSNVLFLELIPENVVSITFGDTYHAQLGQLPRSVGVANPLSWETNTENTTENTTDINKELDISNDISNEKNFKNDNEVEEIEEEKPQKANKRNTFIPPTLDEVTEYCKERGNNIDPEEFIAHYTCRDWYIGKTNRRMKDWKSAVVVWEKNELRYKQDFKPQYGKQNKEPTGMDALKELADEWGVQLP